MLKLEQVQIRQGGFTLAADLTVLAGRKVAVIGPSGAGKSTILGAIAGFTPLERGAITCAGKDLTRLSPGARPISMLFQDNNLFPHLSVFQNAALGLKPNLRLTGEDVKTVKEALARVGLSGFEMRKPGGISGGQQSRAALSRVLLQDKPLVLLDEPFAALGPALRNEMLDLVDALVSESSATLLMVTHAPEDVARIADDVIFVEEGRAHAPAPAAELMENPPPALRVYLG